MNHILKLFMYFYVCVGVYTTFTSSAHEVQKEHLDPLGWLCATMCMLGIELQCSGYQTASALTTKPSF